MSTKAKTQKTATTTKAATKTKASNKEAKAVKVRKPKKDKLDSKNVKKTVKQVVESKREIKYNYPEEIKGPLKRKAFRQKARNHVRALERKVNKATGADKKKYEKQLASYRQEVFLVP